MSRYDITGFSRTAYRPFAYCVPSIPLPKYCYQKGCVSPSVIVSQIISEVIMSDDDELVLQTVAFQECI